MQVFEVPQRSQPRNPANQLTCKPLVPLVADKQQRQREEGVKKLLLQIPMALANIA